MTNLMSGLIAIISAVGKGAKELSEKDDEIKKLEGESKRYRDWWQSEQMVITDMKIKSEALKGTIKGLEEANDIQGKEVIKLQGKEKSLKNMNANQKDILEKNIETIESLKSERYELKSERSALKLNIGKLEKQIAASDKK